MDVGTTMPSRVRLADHTRLTLFSIGVLFVVTLSATALTALQVQLAGRTGRVAAGASAIDEAAVYVSADALKERLILSLVETLVLVIAGGTLLVRVCNPFIRRLEESDARIRAIVCTAADGIVTIDERGTINSFNRAAEQMFLVTEVDVVDRNVDELIELGSCAGFREEQLAGGQPSGGSSESRGTGLRKDGTRFPLEFSLSRVPLGERSIYTLIVRNVTEREAAARQVQTQMLKLREVKEILEAKAAELAETNQELDDFTYIASHDLKEPLRGISAYCQVLLEDYEERLDEDGRRRLEALVGLCQRLGRLIDDLLTYSQIRRSQPDQVAADLNEVAADVLATLGPTIDERGAVVRVVDRLPKMAVDRVWVGEVFRNLITNGMKFNESPQPTVEIGCLAPATIYVRDNGIGIDECHHEAIFAMFRRLHSRRKYEGTGAGLTFVRKIVEAHGGRVWVESQSGCGSTFYFTLMMEPSYVCQAPADRAAG